MNICQQTAAANGPQGMLDSQSLIGSRTSYRVRHADDADEHAENLAEWQQVYDQLSPGRFCGALREIWLGDMQLFRETTNQAVLERGRAWSGARIFGIPISAHGDPVFCDQRVPQGSVFACTANEEFSLRAPKDFDVIAVAIGDEYLRAPMEAEAESERSGCVPGSGDSNVMVGSHRLIEFRSFLATLFETAESDPGLLEHASVQKTLRSALVGHLLAALQASRDAPPRDASYRARKAVVERARHYVLSNLHEPVTIAEVCNEVGVSRRTLQYCFQEILSTNPVQYLRAVRLNSVRRELRINSPETVRVQDVAARWGFWHLSHFANDYKAMFGELPSETLRRLPVRGGNPAVRTAA